jgi:hypothetical protein
MPAAQRLFLMGELEQMVNVELPTAAALRLSMQFIEGGTPPQDPGAFRPTFTDDVWAVTSADRRAIGLYRTAHLQALLNEALAELAPQGIRFIAYAHEAGGDREAIAAGPVLPGWQMSFIVVDNAVLETDARPRLLTYLWVGFAGITTVALIGIVAGQTLGRRLRLAQMKTDLTAAAPSGPVREQPHRVLAEGHPPRVTAARAAGRPRSRPPDGAMPSGCYDADSACPSRPWLPCCVKPSTRAAAARVTRRGSRT